MGIEINLNTKKGSKSNYFWCDIAQNHFGNFESLFEFHSALINYLLIEKA